MKFSAMLLFVSARSLLVYTPIAHMVWETGGWLNAAGASLLWVCWFGFNAGSALAADGRAGMAMLTTQMATGAAALGWMFAEWASKGKPSVLGIASGAVAGLVAVTPASGLGSLSRR
jgi:Amt family ammonium transporter